MITSNVIHRTFHIRYQGASGTAFAIDRNDRQYLVTARHVVPDIVSDSPIEILHERQWKTIQVTVVGVGSGDTDVAVLACPVRLAPSNQLEASSDGLIFGQKVYFLGFPFGWNSGSDSINRDFPLPFVKTGIVSAMLCNEPSHIYIDAHGNEGFSGGPVVFVPDGQPQSVLRVAGIVAAAAIPLLKPVVDESRTPINADGHPIAYFAENQGLVVAFYIHHATDLIDANPIGLEISGG